VCACVWLHVHVCVCVHGWYMCTCVSVCVCVYVSAPEFFGTQMRRDTGFNHLKGCVHILFVLATQTGMSAHLHPNMAEGQVAKDIVVAMELTKIKAENGLATGRFPLPAAGKLVVSVCVCV